MSLNEGSIVVIAKGELVSLKPAQERKEYLPSDSHGTTVTPRCEREETQAVKHRILTPDS